jgi:hypothetical protein
MKLVNLTPHPITIKVDGKELVIQPTKPSARVSTVENLVDPIHYEGIEIPVIESGYGNIVDLPPQQEGVVYITSLIVAQRAVLLGRLDVLAPDTGPTAVRDEQGKILAVTRLVRPKP